jgi:predicted permease
LLLACANVGNLLLARAAARRQEMAVRLSLGGSRFRLIRKLLVESMLLALAAAGLGLMMALVVPPAVVHRLAGDQAFHILPDLNVLTYTMAVAILSCLAFGLAPALHGTRGGISAALKAGAGLEDAQRTRLPLRSVLLAAQVAISVILLANAGLLVRGLQRAQALDPGYDVRHTSVVSIELPASQYTGPRTMELTQDLLAQLNRSTDLPASGLVLNPPLSNANYSTSFQLTERPGSPMLHIFTNEISGGYVDALGMRLLAGRNFVPEDSGRNVLIINAAAAKRWWPGENPLGKTVLADGKMRQIVGVISDTYSNDLSSIEAVIYFPITGHWGAPFIVVHERGAAADQIAALVKQIEPRAQVRAPSRWPPVSAASCSRRFTGRSWPASWDCWRWRSPRWACPECLPTWWASARGRSACAWRWGRNRRKSCGWCWVRARAHWHTDWDVASRELRPYRHCWPTLSPESIHWTHWHTPVWRCCWARQWCWQAPSPRGAPHEWTRCALCAGSRGRIPIGASLSNAKVRTF